MKNILNILSSTHSPLLAGNFIYGIEDTAGKETAEKGAGVKSEGMDTDFQNTLEKGLNATKNAIIESADLASEAVWEMIEGKSELAADPNTSIQNLRKLEKNRDPKIDLQLANNPNAPADMLLRLARNSDGDIKGYVAKNPSLPPRAANILYKEHAEYSVISGLAENPSTPTDILLRIAEEHPAHSRDVLANPSITDELLQNLVKIAFFRDNDMDLKLHINDPRVSADTVRFIYENLGKSATRGINVMYHIIRSPNTPDDVLKSIAKGSEPLIKYKSPREAKYSAKLNKEFAKEELEKRKG